MDPRLSLLPLNSLRAFEAAARHLSFSHAADELGVTPAAVSHQIRALEERLGHRLFLRRTRAVELTDAGRRLLPGVAQGFTTLVRAVAELGAPEDESVLTVTASPSVAARWLLPRLDGFQSAHPDLDIRISASNRLVDLGREWVDVGLRFGQGNYPGMHIDRLMDVDLFPVCSPDMVTPQKPLNCPADLAHHTLLHDESWSWRDGPVPGWEMWLKAIGETGVDARRGMRLDGAALTLEAAAMGRGVALASSGITGDDLASGRLIRPFDPSLDLPLDLGIFFVCQPETLERPAVAAFRDWVLAEVAAGSRILPG